MRLEIINDLFEETKRIFMAGARLAPGDIRLKKHIETLNKLGEKSPPFKKLAEKFLMLYSADENTAGEALIEASALLEAIAVVMSSPVEDSALIDNDGYINTLSNYPLSYTVSDDILTNKKHKIEPINGSFDYFRDIRFRDFIIESLRGGADETVIPNEVIATVGEELIPPLLEIINNKKTKPKGKSAAARALSILSYSGAYDILCEVFDEGTYMLEAAESLINDPKGLMFLKMRFEEVMEKVIKTNYEKVSDMPHQYFLLAFMIYSGDELFDIFKVWYITKFTVNFSSVAVIDRNNNHNLKYLYDKTNSIKWHSYFKSNDDLLGLTLLHYNDKNKLEKDINNYFSKNGHGYNLRLVKGAYDRLETMMNEKEIYKFKKQIEDLHNSNLSKNYFDHYLIDFNKYINEGKNQ